MAFRRKRTINTEQRQCDICEQWFSAGGGFATHTRACAKRREKENNDTLLRANREHHSSGLQSSIATTDTPTRFDDILESGAEPTGGEDAYIPGDPTDQPILDTSSGIIAVLDDIHTDYHPASHRPAEQVAFEDFGLQDSDSHTPYDPVPWRPFPTRFDFEVADLALRCSMNRDQTNKLLKLLDMSHHGAKASMHNYDDMQKLWDAAADRTTRTITVPYKDEDRNFDVHYRPLWDWILGMVKDPHLAPQMEWDARHHYRYNGTTWDRFIDEPWTADSWWEAQSKINLHSVQGGLDAKPLCLIIYVDKNKLSSFGTAKGYPVIATIGNLSSDIRNGSGPGGGRVVGWLPVVEEESKNSRKTSFVDFKAVVWHQSAIKMFESIQLYCEVGCVVDCGDGICRLLYPILLALSADYEEQCAMCLIRGLRALHPCPKCMVGKDQLSWLSERWESRTPEDTARVIKEASEMGRKGDREDLLKQYSLRYGQNAFLSFINFNPYDAVSFDDLHFDDSGLWGAHLFPQLKKHMAKIGRNVEAEVDRRFKSFPRWRNLSHFDAVTTVTFNDGSKHRDISKMFLFAAEQVFTRSEDPAAYQLLKCTRAYLNVIMYAGLHVQTTETMRAGRKAVLVLLSYLSDYMDIPKIEELDDKSWEFIKLHYHAHLFDDIQRKGALRNFSTRPFEKKHGPIRVIYQRRTNFKNIAPQILNVTHQMDVSDLVWADIHAMEEYGRYLQEQLSIEVPNDVEELPSLGGGHFTIGSKLKAITFQQFGIEHSLPSDRFRIDLANFMSKSLIAHNIPLLDNRWIQYHTLDTITPFQYLKINYESYETWKLGTDYIRCNPSFQRHPRYDFILFSSEDGPVFGQLQNLFVCKIGEASYPVAYIQSYRVIHNTRRDRSDKDFGILRIKKDAKEFISVHSIIRGALVVSASSADRLEEERLVVDVLDSDMFLRIKKHWPSYTN
ncbi:hypothetical protein VNI00_014300 [Paramarasmius palmivorus]|uniref:Uncharacterized protein n=1 Tax=Paramarasmius palmivorus TaxID=297713 RepID=A0AAW0BUC8_9AGAR